jgi:hypothetical protein
MSDTIAEVRSEPDRVCACEASVSIPLDVATIGTSCEHFADLLTDHPLVVRPDPSVAPEEWLGFLAASEASSLSFLANEPDLYGDDGGEPIQSPPFSPEG